MSEHLFSPSKALTFETVQSDSRRLQQMLQDDAISTVRFDLQAVERCDSAGISLLIEAKRVCKQHGKHLIIEGIPKAIVALAEFCAVDQLLDAST